MEKVSKAGQIIISLLAHLDMVNVIMGHLLINMVRNVKGIGKMDLIFVWKINIINLNVLRLSIVLS